MAQIIVAQTDDFPHAEFNVTVSDNTTTQHTVTLTKDYYEKLTGASVLPVDLIKKSFEFLLSRESNTSILPEFNLTVIANYFPAYEKEMQTKFLPEA